MRFGAVYAGRHYSVLMQNSLQTASPISSDTQHNVVSFDRGGFDATTALAFNLAKRP